MSCFIAGTFAKVPVMGNKIRLTDNWEFLRQDVGNIWELVRPIKKGQPEEQPIWTKVTLPHCFNAEDAVDPDLNYYQGPGWYKNVHWYDLSDLCRTGLVRNLPIPARKS